MSSGRIPRVTGASAGRALKDRSSGTLTAGDTNWRASPGRVDAPLEQVHLRAPDERRHERVDRAEVDSSVVPDLLDDAVAEDDDAVRHRHRLDLVVGDVQRRAADASMELQQLGAHLDPQERVEVRERLVHEERDRMADDRPTERDPLALPARQLPGIPRQHPLEAEQLRDLGDLGGHLGLGLAAHLQREAEVALDGHVRIERVVLEDHRDIAVAGLDEVRQPTVDVDLAVGRVLEAGDDLEDRALAAARGPEQDEELAGRYGQVDAGQGVHRSVALRERHELDASGGWRGRSSCRSLLEGAGE